MPDPGPFHDVIQIAGISDFREAGLVLDCGVRCLGFPLRLPVNAEDLSETEAANIIRSIQPPGYGVAITYQDNADDIIAFMDFLGAPVVQLHGDIGFGELERGR
jgi:phosphoribosylanthranilate isomerase